MRLQEAQVLLFYYYLFKLQMGFYPVAVQNQSQTAAVEPEITKLAMFTNICFWASYLTTSINLAYS
jgi:hypothetical protein